MVRNFLILFLLFFITTSSIYSQENKDLRIEVNLPACTLYVYKNGQIIATYSVAVGSPKTPTPMGQYYIASMEKEPVWYPPPKKIEKTDSNGNTYFDVEYQDPVPAGPDNPLGKYWMGLDRDELGIHSTNNPSSIGYSVSHGCIRMHPDDVPKLFNIVSIGVKVDIVYKTTDLLIDHDTGNAYLLSYADIYGKDTNSFNEIKSKLDRQSIPYEKDTVKNVLAQGAGHYTLISKNYRVNINGDKSSIKTIYPLENLKNNKKDFYICQRDWNEKSISQIDWNSKTGKALVNGKSINSIIYDGKSYVNATELAKTLEIDYTIDKKERTLNFNSLIMNLNGQSLKNQARLIKDRAYIGISSFSNETGIIFTWDQKKKEAKFDNIAIKGILVTGKGFLPVDKLAEHFALHIEKKKKRVIDLTYPEVELNDISLKEKAFLYHSEIYIALRELRNISGIKFEWKSEKKSAIIGSKEVSGKEFNNVAFIPLNSLYKIGIVDVERVQNTLINIELTKIVINNNFASLEGYKDGSTREIMISINDLSKAVNIPFTYNQNNKTVKFKDKNLPSVQRKEGIYISLNSLSIIDGTQIDYDRQEKIISISI